MTAFLQINGCCMMYFTKCILSLIFFAIVCSARRNLLQIPRTNISLPRGDWGMAVGYSTTNDLIWLLGGIKYGQQLVSFNPNRLYWNDAITDYTTNALPNDIYFYGQGYVQKNEILYMIDPSGTKFNIFDLNTQQFAYNWNNIIIPTNVGDGSCLSIICDNYLVVIGGYDGSTYLSMIQIYNINTGEWLTGNLPTMSTPRDRATCMMSSDDLYLYVLGGRKNGVSNSGWLDTIEKLYVGNVNCIHEQQFELLNTTLLDPKMQLRSVIYSNDIYTVGGTYWTSQTQSTNKVGHLDTSTETLSKLDNLRQNTANTAVVIAKHTMFVLGAYLQTWKTKEQPSIQYHHFNISEYEPPPATNCPAWPSDRTCNPTAHPTINPTFPTVNPTATPTKNPSSATINPTGNPTTNPTLPTINPTAIPTKPTSEPSNNPTIKPTLENIYFTPTNNPTKENDASVTDATNLKANNDADAGLDGEDNKDNDLIIYALIGVGIFVCCMILVIIFWVKKTKSNAKSEQNMKYMPNSITGAALDGKLNVNCESPTNDEVNAKNEAHVIPIPGSPDSANHSLMTEMVDMNFTEGVATATASGTAIGDEELEYTLKSNNLYSQELYETLTKNNIDSDTLRNDVKQNEIDELCKAFNIGYKDKLNLRKLWRILNDDEGNNTTTAGTNTASSQIQTVPVPAPDVDEQEDVNNVPSPPDPPNAHQTPGANQIYHQEQDSFVVDGSDEENIDDGNDYDDAHNTPYGNQ